MSTERNLVDSSGWIEYFTGSPNAGFFAAAIEDTERLLVPTLSVAEVFTWVLRERGESAALQAAALMQQGEVVDLDLPLALHSAKSALEQKLSLADSVIYATAQLFGATLWTQDAHFEGLPNVRFTRKQPVACLNGEVLHLLEQSVGTTRIDPDSFLARVRGLQERTGLPPLTEEILDQAMGEDRP